MTAPAPAPADPFVLVVDDALPAALCDEVVARFLASPHRRPGATGGGVDPARKDSQDVTITDHPGWADVVAALHAALAPPLRAYARRFGALLTGAVATALADPATGAPRPLAVDAPATLDDAALDALWARLYRLGPVNVQRYARGRGGYHHWHSEVFPAADGGEALHRVLLVQVYLDDVAEGGETELLYQGLRVAPRRGRLLVAPAGFTHTHKGHVPRSSDKTVLTSWVMFRRAEELYGPAR